MHGQDGDVVIAPVRRYHSWTAGRRKMPNIGLPEIAIILVIALIVFGPKRLPELGRSMGKGIREFKNSLTSDKDDDEVPEIERSRSEAATRAEEAPLVEGEVVHDRRS
jgi:sec-independent protein translocase protein TatA